MSVKGPRVLGDLLLFFLQTNLSMVWLVGCSLLFQGVFALVIVSMFLLFIGMVVVEMVAQNKVGRKIGPALALGMLALFSSIVASLLIGGEAKYLMALPVRSVGYEELATADPQVLYEVSGLVPRDDLWGLAEDTDSDGDSYDVYVYTCLPREGAGSALARVWGINKAGGRSGTAYLAEHLPIDSDDVYVRAAKDAALQRGLPIGEDLTFIEWVRVAEKVELLTWFSVGAVVVTNLMVLIYALILLVRRAKASGKDPALTP